MPDDRRGRRRPGSRVGGAEVAGADDGDRARTDGSPARCEPMHRSRTAPGRSAACRLSREPVYRPTEPGTASLCRVTREREVDDVKVLGINALFHDPAAALVVDGVTVAAAEEERFSRRKHGKRPVPFAAWELPELAARWCLESAGLEPRDLDAVAYSYDPALARPAEELGARRPLGPPAPDVCAAAPRLPRHGAPGPRPGGRAVRPPPRRARRLRRPGLAGSDTDVLVLDGRGECASHLAGRYDDGRLETLAGPRSCRTPSACSTRRSPSTWASCAAATSTR